MKCFTIQEFESQCETNQLEVPFSGAVSFKRGENYRAITELSDSVQMQKSLIREVSRFFEKESGIFVQLRCWNEFSLDGGIVQMISALRRQNGEVRSISESPVFFFSSEELDLCLGLLDIIVAFNWEAVWFSASSCNFICTHLDGHLVFVTNHLELLREITGEMIATGSEFKEF